MTEGFDWENYDPEEDGPLMPAPETSVDDEVGEVPRARTYVPHPYQLAGIDRMVEQATLGLFWDPGLGKTSAILAAFERLRSKGLVRRMLVISPLRPAYGVWPRELRKWEEFSHLKMGLLHGNLNHRVSILHGDFDIHVINPEGLRWLLMGDRVARFAGATRRKEADAAVRQIDWFWDMLVVDESTKFKHTNTFRFRTLRPFVSKFRRRYILTGTPAPNGLMDLFGQMYLLDEGAALGNRVTAFRNRWFHPTGYGGYEWAINAGADVEIREAIRPLVMRLETKDYLTMPPLVNNTVRVDLPDDARRAYTSMENLLIAEVSRGMVTAANASVAVNKCRQIANGGIYHDVWDVDFRGRRRATNYHEAKVDAVEEIVEELQGKPALVAYEYQHDLARLKERFPGAPWLGGGISTTQQADIEARWNAGKIPVLLAQPQSVAHGLNLQGTAAAVIFHSLPWDLEVYDQFVRRVWRQGQEERVVVHHIVANKTVDEAVMRALAFKDMTQRGLLDALKAHLREN